LPVLDERQPDPNLTMVAVVNELPAETLQDCPQAALCSGLRCSFGAGPHVFQAIFAIRACAKKCKPPLDQRPQAAG
jgi:hypothetical protein